MINNNDDYQNKTGRAPTRFHYFKKVNDILGKKPSSQCLHSLESSSLVNLLDENVCRAAEEPEDINASMSSNSPPGGH